MKKIVLSFILVCIFSGCNLKTQQKGKINIVSTTFPCYDAVRAIAGTTLNDGTIDSLMLLKPGMEVHSFDPTPQNIISIQKSDLFIYVGGESDEWVENILENTNISDGVKKLKLINYAELTEEPEGLEEKNHEHHDEEEDNEENPHEADEHIWTNPENEIKIIQAVLKEMINIAEEKNLPSLAEIFSKNAEKYIQQIRELISETREIVKESNKIIVMADRFPFIYFTEYYGIEYLAAFNGCSTAVEASVNTISKLIDKIKDEKISAVYYLELGNHKIADSVAESCNVPAYKLQSCQNLSLDDFNNGESWLSLMKKNAEVLKKGWKN